MMKLKEAKDIVENAEIINPETEHSFVKGCYGKKYLEATRVLAHKHRDDPCPPNLTKTKYLDCDGFRCKVFYNYVPSYSYGSEPLNCWWGLLETCPEGFHLIWKCPLDESVKTLEEACKVIMPVFEEAVKRAKKLFEANREDMNDNG